MKYLYLVHEGHGVLLSGEVDPVPCPFLPGDALGNASIAFRSSALPHCSCEEELSVWALFILGCVYWVTSNREAC